MHSRYKYCCTGRRERTLSMTREGMRMSQLAPARTCILFLLIISFRLGRVLRRCNHNFSEVGHHLTYLPTCLPLQDTGQDRTTKLHASPRPSL
uniref:Uncharacterized protein n=1 Tax=Setaria italica TaxID=4555 RepID=K3ZFS3_SETIT